MGATRGNLDADLLGDYLRRLRREKPRMFLGGEQEALRLSKVLVTDPEGQLTPSVAALLAMGSYPQEFFPQVNLTFVVYPQKIRGEPGPGGARFLDNVAFDGPVPIIAGDVMVRLRQRMARRSIISGVARRDVYEYPEEAVREAVVNALAHRDLSAGALGTQVQVEMFPDRLEVRNPGGLFGLVDVEDLPSSATSSARNAALYRILEQVSLPDGGGPVCENRRSGVKAMITSLRAAGMSLPRFTDGISSFEVTFLNATLLDEETVAWLAGLGLEGLTDSQVLGLARMHHGEVMKNATYRRETGVDSRVATAELRDLVARGVIVGEGSRGSSTYSVPAGGNDRVGTPRASTPSLLDGLDYAGEDPVPLVALPVWRALATGPKSRVELETDLNLESHHVLYRLRKLRAAGLVQVVGEPKSRQARWRRS